MRRDFPPEYSEEGISVKGEEEIVEAIFFRPEEEIVERELERPLTTTPEEYAEPEQELE